MIKGVSDDGETSTLVWPVGWVVCHPCKGPRLTSSELEVAAGTPRSACVLGLQGKDLLLQLEEETLKLVEPQSQALLHAQPIVSIRVWGVGRDSGRWAHGLGSQGGG